MGKPQPLINEYTIPLLPCNSINQTIEFYQALGFAVTYQQKRPNIYAALKRGAIELHFFVLKELKPESNFSSCYVVVSDVDSMYESFTTGIRSWLGRVPMQGFPRINPLRDMPTYGVRQFIVVDPTGNYIRIGQPIAKADSLVYAENNENKGEHSGTDLEKAYELGSRLADAKGDFAAAVKVLDEAIERADPSNGNAIVWLRVLILRTDLAIRLQDYTSAHHRLVQAQSVVTVIDPKTIREESRLIKELQTLLEES